MVKNLKLDVTDRIQIKINGEDLILLDGKKCIGKLVIKENEKQYDLVEGYTYENRRIYRVFLRDDICQSYTKDCDLGWC